MPEDIQQKTQVENISPSLESKGDFLNQIKWNQELTQEQKNKIINLYNSIQDKQLKEEFEVKVLEDVEFYSNQFEIEFTKLKEKFAKDKLENEKKAAVNENLISEQIHKNTESIEKSREEINKIKKEKLIEEAQTKINSFYELFWWKDWLNKKLQENWIDVGRLKSKAEESVKKDNPWIDENSDEFKSKVEISFIANNKSQISSVLPEDKKQQFEALYSDIITSAKRLWVDCPQKVDYGTDKKYWLFDKERIIISERQEIAISIPNGTEVSRRWWIISYEEKNDWYTVEINIDEKPPERRIKWEWVDIKVKNEDIRYESRYEFIVKRRKIEWEIKWIKEYLSNNKSKVEQLKSSNQELEKDFNTRLENFKRWVYLERTESGQLRPINLPAPQNREVAEQWLKEDYEKIMKDRQIIKVYEEQIKLLEQKEKELIDLKKAEQESIYRFKRAIQERDEVAKSNIKYLAKTHLNVFWENNIDKIVELFNKYRTINWDAWARPVDIDNEFRDSDKSIMINWMSKLLWWMKYFKNINEPIDYIDWKLVDNRFIVDKLVSTWILGKDRITIDFNKIEELLKKWGSAKPQEEKKSN